jgi:hypothetical protein
MIIVSKHPLFVGTALVALVAGALYGCKDFLTDASAPQGTLGAETLANRAGIEGTLIGAYRALDCSTSSSAWGCAASNWVFGSVASDDSYKGSDGGDQPPINDIEGYHWGTPRAEEYLNGKWAQVYEGVVRSNSAIRLLNQVLTESPDEFSAFPEEPDLIEGEALFLRAHYHFEAWRMWGRVPYYREDDTDFRKPNLTSAEVVTELLADLNAAIAKLPTEPRNGQKGRATRWTAKAYKGRVQVYAGQFADAVTTLRDVVNNGPYELEESFDHVWTGFSDRQNGLETIWAYQASNDDEPGGQNANFGERLNFPYSGSHFGCCGFNQPTQNLVNFFRVDAAGLPLALSAPSTWNASDANFTASDLSPVDPRLDWTVGRDRVPFKDWGLYLCSADKDECIDQAWVRDPDNGGPYGPKKNVHEEASGAESSTGWQPQQLNSVNIHLYRYADLLLLLAEALVETNDLAGATALVNQVRARAGVKAQGPGTSADNIAVPINSTSITWAIYRVGQYPVFPNQAYAREAVRAERRLELAMEGQRLFDLRRWDIAETILNGYVNGIGGGAEENRRLYLRQAEEFAEKHSLYPLPQIQIDLSKVGGQSTLTQNPGW